MKELEAKLLLDKYSQDFASLYDLYEEFNSHTNISAIRDREGVYTKHFEDSLEVVKMLCVNSFSITNSRDIGVYTKHFEDSLEVVKILWGLIPSKERQTAKSIIDVGTGGGFPSLPLAIVLRDLMPSLQIYALDATKKKLEFLQIVKEELGLNNLVLIHARAEEFGHLESEFREYFDFALARSVAHLSVLLELCTPLIDLNAYILSYKNKDIQEEWQEAQSAIKSLKLKSLNKHEYADKQLICFKKTSTTSSKYPRSYAQIKAKPL